MADQLSQLLKKRIHNYTVTLSCHILTVAHVSFTLIGINPVKHGSIFLVHLVKASSKLKAFSIIVPISHKPTTLPFFKVSSSKIFLKANTKCPWATMLHKHLAILELS